MTSPFWSGLGTMDENEYFPHIPYNKNLLPKARELRNNPTPPEKTFWNALRKMPFYRAAKFNRQKPLGKYIVDFYCHRFRLVIEIDGDSHASESARKYDQKRTDFLEAQGLQVVRFTNREVPENIEGAMQTLEEIIGQNQSERP